MFDELLEQTGSFSKLATWGEKLPWYGVTAGSMGGAAAGSALGKKLPGKLKPLATVAGGLLGTAAGLEGGSALGKKLDQAKTAEVGDFKDRFRRSAKILGTGMLGLGAGMLTGYGAGRGADAISKHFTGQPIAQGRVAKIAPIIGGGLGIAHALWKAREVKELIDVQQTPGHAPSTRVSGQ